MAIVNSQCFDMEWMVFVLNFLASLLFYHFPCFDDHHLLVFDQKDLRKNLNIKDIVIIYKNFLFVEFRSPFFRFFRLINNFRLIRHLNWTFIHRHFIFLTILISLSFRHLTLLIIIMVIPLILTKHLVINILLADLVVFDC